MADFDKISINRTYYDVKDTTARQQISAETTAREQAVNELVEELSQTNTTVKGHTQDIADLVAEDSTLQSQITELAKKTGLETAKIIVPQQFGARGDGVTDDTAAFKAAIQAAYDQGATLYIPATGNLDEAQGYNGYILSETLNINKPITILADPLSVLNWKNMTANPTQSGSDPQTGAIMYSTGVGINIDYGNYANHKGTYRFGIIQGPMSYYYPGASGPSGHYGWGVRIANGDLVSFYAKYISYWLRGITLEANVNFTGNETIEWDVMDDCQEGITLQSNGTQIIEGVNIRFNTIGLCKYGIHFTRQNTSSIFPVIHGVTIEGAEIWSEYTNGACIYSETEKGDVQNIKISIGECYNVCNPSTSKEGITQAYYGPIVSGTGNRCFKGTNIELDVGVVISNDAQLSDRGAVGLDGQISFHNRIEQYANNYDTAYTAASSASATFNNGKIPVANRMFVKFALPASVSAGQTITYYVKMQNSPSGAQASPFIWPSSAYPATMTITNFSNYTNYQTYKIDICALQALDNWTLYAVVGI